MYSGTAITEAMAVSLMVMEMIEPNAGSMRTMAWGRMISRISLRVRHAEREGGARLPWADGGDAGADDLGDVGGDVQRQRDKRGPEGRQREAGDDGQCEVGPDQDDKDGHRAHRVDIEDEGHAQPGRAVAAREADGGANQEGAEDGEEGEQRVISSPDSRNRQLSRMGDMSMSMALGHVLMCHGRRRPATHDLPACHKRSRGWPGQARP